MNIKSKFYLLTLIIITVIGIASPNVFAYDWAKENSAGIPSLVTPFFVPNTGNAVTSSYNEPRTSEIHKGTDHTASIGTQIGPMYGSSSYMYANGAFTDGTKYQVIRMVNGSTTSYSLYLHLSKSLITTVGQQVFLSDKTAETGDTGAPGSPHLHFEINSNDPTSNFGARISVNPRDYFSDSLQYNRSVFKNWSVGYVSTNSRTINIKAEDYNLGSSQPLSYVNIYYKLTSSSTWTGPNAMTNGGSGNFSYSLTGFPGQTWDVVIAGRRATNEYWVTFPVKKYTEVGTGTSIPMSSLGTWDTMTVSY
jgi:hypothetical protein